MPGYLQILTITLPVFVLFALGTVLRHFRVLSEEAEGSVLKLIINILYPCLILRSVLGNPALRDPANLAGAPLAGFATLLLGMGLGLWAGRVIRLEKGTGLRTFAFAVGVFNYGYIPIPLVDALWGKDTVGVLLLNNVGIEAGLWTIGILLLSGVSLREGWHKLVNPVVLSLIAGLLLNFAHITLPPVLLRVVNLLADCAVPLGLLSAGAAIHTYVRTPATLVEPRTAISACVIRLALMPVIFIALACWLPFSIEMKRILVVQAAMPAGMLPLVIARHYGGQPVVAARVIIATTVVGMLVLPSWISFGLGVIE